MVTRVACVGDGSVGLSVAIDKIGTTLKKITPRQTTKNKIP
jgi:hypothetical protein